MSIRLSSVCKRFITRSQKPAPGRLSGLFIHNHPFKCDAQRRPRKGRGRSGRRASPTPSPKGAANLALGAARAQTYPTAGHWLQHRNPRAPCPCAMFSAQPHTHTSPALRHSRTAPGRSGAPMQVAASDRWQPACFAPACRICLRPAHKRRAKPNCGPYAHSRHSRIVRVLHASPHALIITFERHPPTCTCAAPSPASICPTARSLRPRRVPAPFSALRESPYTPG